MTVSSMMPPFSLSMTDKVELYGDSIEREDGVNHSRKAVALGPRKLQWPSRQRATASKAVKAHLDCTMCPTSNRPAQLRTWLWLATDR